MSDIYHGTGFEQAVLFLGRALRLEHIIRILGLAEHIHQSAIEGVGVIAALVVE